MILFSVLTGLVAGIVSTAIMTLTEIPSWKRWGLPGLFEWHENQILCSRILNLTDGNRIHYGGIFSLHFLNGTLAGIAFPFIVSLFILMDIVIPIYLLGILYGIVLWAVTLIPIHKPITGFSPWNHPLGHLPALASINGPTVYGFVLGLLTSLLIG